MEKNNTLKYLLPVMLSFFCMGFVDLVGAAANYVKEDFALSETATNIFPSMVFFWFLLFAVPTGVLMNKIGRRKTVLISLVVTALSMVVPFIAYSYTSMLIAFSLLGIGNALMQVSLNPLLSSIVSGDNRTDIDGLFPRQFRRLEISLPALCTHIRAHRALARIYSH